jgi:hypothetical protein
VRRGDITPSVMANNFNRDHPTRDYKSFANTYNSFYFKGRIFQISTGFMVEEPGMYAQDQGFGLIPICYLDFIDQKDLTK